jgi:hypothetical protein
MQKLYYHLLVPRKVSLKFYLGILRFRGNLQTSLYICKIKEKSQFPQEHFDKSQQGPLQDFSFMHLSY